MSRLKIIRETKAESAARGLYGDLARRGAVAPASNCPVEQSAAFIRLCLSQSCGKCVPCRVGLRQLAAILDRVLNGQGREGDLTRGDIESMLDDSADTKED